MTVNMQDWNKFEDSSETADLQTCLKGVILK